MNKLLFFLLLTYLLNQSVYGFQPNVMPPVPAILPIPHINQNTTDLDLQCFVIFIATMHAVVVYRLVRDYRKLQIEIKQTEDMIKKIKEGLAIQEKNQDIQRKKHLR